LPWVRHREVRPALDDVPRREVDVRVVELHLDELGTVTARAEAQQAQPEPAPPTRAASRQKQTARAPVRHGLRVGGRLRRRRLRRRPWSSSWSGQVTSAARVVIALDVSSLSVTPEKDT